MEDEVTRAVTGLGEYRLLDAVEVDGVLELIVDVARDEAACPRCGVFSGRVKQRSTQRVRDGLSFERPTVVVWHKRRFRCDTPGCRPTFTESTEAVPARSRLTVRLRGALGRAGRCRSTAEVADAHRVSWWTAWRAIEAAAAVAIDRARLDRPPARLGLDETTFRRPQRFATGIVDLDTGRLWDLMAGRSKSVVAHRLAALDDDRRATIADVVIDPFAGYKAAVRDLAPDARCTADRFHIVRLANQAVTDVRCRRQQELTGRRGRKPDPFYRARRDLLRARERLTDRQAARVRLALGADPADELWAAWVAKEGIRDLYHQPDRDAAGRALADWQRVFGNCGVPELERLATTLGRWAEEIINYFDSRLTNGRSEGRNLIIKTVKRAGFGFRNFDHYRLRVLYRCT